MPRLPDSYYNITRIRERERARNEKAGTEVRKDPWPTYDINFVRSELRRYETDWREWYDHACRRSYTPRVSTWNPNGLNEVELYRSGMLRTFNWFLGAGPSAIHGAPPPPTETDFENERRAAHCMQADRDRCLSGTPVEEVFGGFEPFYILGVYKTLKWLTMGPENRSYRQAQEEFEPMLFG